MRDDARNLEVRLHWLAIAAVALFGVTLAAGLLMHVVSPGSATSQTLLEAGILFLMLAPAMRVIIAVAERVRRRDWRFVLMTVAVAVELGVVMWRASQKL